MSLQNRVGNYHDMVRNERDIKAQFSDARAAAMLADDTRAYFDAGAAEAKAIIELYAPSGRTDARDKVRTAAFYLRTIAQHTSAPDSLRAFAQSFLTD
jgi:hypothetical protein